MPIPEVLRNALADRYRIERELGAGGMATVYVARDLKHDRDVAIKVLKAELGAPSDVQRFLAEIRITASLQHPHILTLIDSGVLAGVPYYVVPYIRGESLRDRLDRERQLSFADAVAIAKPIAAALDYAHAHGVVHRDVKPHNILLQDGEAILADFGIALAMEHVGGQRLTESSSLIGTPQYMSPEQLSGVRHLDARSDVYALGAVVYEMLAGEPPATGVNLQALLARVLHEAPTPLHLVRSTVPLAAEQVIGRALAKTPADRFPSAGAFVDALDEALAENPQRLATTVPLAHAPAHRVARRAVLLAVSGVALTGAAFLWMARRPHAPVHVVLGDRTQRTTTGNVSDPAISPDGEALAFVTSSCVARGCTYGVEVQYTGERVPKQLVSGATALYGLEWSADRLHLLVTGTFHWDYGTHLVPADGGPPQRVSPVFATFWGSDSLLSIRATRDVHAAWLLVSGLDAGVRDSIRVPLGPNEQLRFPMPMPGRHWIVVGVRGPQGMEWRIISRDDTETDRLVVPARGVDDSDAVVSSDALWTPERLKKHGGLALIRFPFDSATGRFVPPVDTLYPGDFTAISVTADGRSLVLDDANTVYDAWATDIETLTRASSPLGQQIAQSTAPLSALMSPDGKRLLLGRDLTPTGQGAPFWSIRPFVEDSETALSGKPVRVQWNDASTVVLEAPTSAGIQLAIHRFGAATDSNTLTVRESSIVAFTNLPGGGWAWIPEDAAAIEYARPGAAVRRIPLPSWYSAAIDIDAFPGGNRVAFVGWNQPNEDSLRVGTMTLPDGAVTTWATYSGENAQVQRLPDGSLLLYLADTPQTYSIYRVRGPGQVEPIARMRQPMVAVSLSADLRHAAAITSTRRADAVQYQLVRR